MKIILENELEKWAWGVMISAHYKWEKNYGSVLQDKMSWYFEDIYKDEREETIKQEVERRLRDNWDDDYGLSEEEYVVRCLTDLNDRDEDEKRAYENELREEYKTLQEDIANDREGLTETVKEELRDVYYTFFNAPEDLTVIYNGEVIQGKKQHERCL